jgi:hypothetical protein
MSVPIQTQTATKTVATKTMKTNPSAVLIGKKLHSPDSILVNFRKGKTNVVLCNEIECTAANPAGRRLTLVFRDAKGQEIMTRRCFKEHFAKMAEKFNVAL